MEVSSENDLHYHREKGSEVSKVVSSELSMVQTDKTSGHHSEKVAYGSIVVAAAATVELEPEPIPSDWILSGSPEARCKKLVRSRDWTSHLVVWDCTPGSFKWNYSMDETIVIISGEAFMSNDNGEERRFGPGDLAFFPAGSSCSWRVTQTLRKVGILREGMWRPLGLCLKVWRKVLRTAGLAGQSPLMLAVAAGILANHR
jgi:uncharacterized cupin superfamily protein